MGSVFTCCQRSPKDRNVGAFGSSEPEIEFNKYISSSDKNVEIIETKFNLISSLSLATYLNLLNEYSLETATLTNRPEIKTEFTNEDSLLKDELTSDELQPFFEGKLKKNPFLRDQVDKDEGLFTAFKDTYDAFYEALKTRLVKKKEFNISETLYKKHLIVFGLLYCQSSNVGKVKLFFDLFKKEDKIIFDKEMEQMLFTLFTAGSYCPVYALNKLQTVHKKYIKTIEKSEITRMVNISQTKDTENLINLTKEKIWGDSEEGITYSEFKSKFENHEIDWLFNSKGIRKVMEDNDQ
ncbi:MAG: hypothetical protein MJ252_01755 [archaeon]|nr:hypothetical protein [archaeon]